VTHFSELSEYKEIKQTTITRNGPNNSQTEVTREVTERRVERTDRTGSGAKALLQTNEQPGHAFIRGVSHINIGVTDLPLAIDYYQRLFNVTPVRIFEQFRNIGFAQAAGFLDQPEQVSVSIAFVEIPGTGLTLELMQYHNPPAQKVVRAYKVNAVGGVRHIALKVVDIDLAFAHVKSLPENQLINASPEYKPFKIDPIQASEFRLYDSDLEADKAEKDQVCRIVGNIRYFYFIDPHGVQWDFEQGHAGIGTDTGPEPEPEPDIDAQNGE
jgi:maltose O-acetyltransferase